MQVTKSIAPSHYIFLLAQLMVQPEIEYGIGTETAVSSIYIVNLATALGRYLYYDVLTSPKLTLLFTSFGFVSNSN